MKILIILYYYHPYVSGLSLLAKTQAEGLSCRGHDVTVLCMRHEKDLPEAETINGVKVVRAETLVGIDKGLVSWDFLKKIIALSKDHDIVNPHLPMAHFGLVLPFVDKKKIVTQYHCDLNLGKGLVSWALQRFAFWSMNKTLKHSSRIIATTEDYFSSCRFAQYTSSVSEIYPPVDQSRFNKRDVAAIRKSLGVNEGDYLIGFVGRIVEEKGIEYLLRAIPALEEKIEGFKILLAGDYEKVAGGAIKDKIDVFAGEFPDRVKFVGHLKFNDLLAFYSLIDVLVLPSVDPLEAFGMVQLEAMLCGTPVVATNMPGVRHVVQKTGFGRLVKARDPQDIADKIVELRECPANVCREELAAFDSKISIDKYEETFSEVHNFLS